MMFFKYTSTALLILSLFACSGSSTSSPTANNDGGNDANDQTMTTGDQTTDQGMTDSSELTTLPTDSNEEVGVVSQGTASEPSTDGTASAETRRLINELDSSCVPVNQTFALTVTELVETSTSDIPQRENITPFVDIIQTNSTAINLISRTDNEISLSMTKQDISAITSQVDNGSVTTYIAAFSEDAPATVILRKPVPGGCLFGFRLDTDRYCATAFAKGVTLDLFLLDEGISITGCEVDNPLRYPIVDLPAE